MSSTILPGILQIDEPIADLEQAYRQEVRWQQGLRINLDSRLLLLGLRRLVSYGLIRESDLRNAQFVVGCRLGAMDSYELFDESLMRGAPAPLSFAYALPSMPLACASVYYGLRGATYTVVGGNDIGLRAYRQAIALLPSVPAGHVVTGCWETPSQTARRGVYPGRCRLLLAVVCPASAVAADPDAATCAQGGMTKEEDCVDMLARHFGLCRANTMQEARHA